MKGENGCEDRDYGESGPPSDLFTEIHGGEFAKLERKIEAAENERIQMAKAAADTKSQLERSREEVQVGQLEVHREFRLANHPGACAHSIAGVSGGGRAARGAHCRH